MTSRITYGKGLLMILALSLAIVSLIACSAPTPTPVTGSQPPVVGADIRAASQFQNGGAYGANTGIVVTGTGEATAAPDLAVLNLGVEAFAGTVKQARSDAADGMSRVLDTLRSAGVADGDMQTSYFNIYPRYTSSEVTRCPDTEGGVVARPETSGAQEPPILKPEGGCATVREQVISGFQVTNQLTVKVRNLDEVGQVIDLVTEAGGDLIRFQGVNFTIEETEALEQQARATAMADLQSKAGQLAQLAGVELGRPVFISESGGSPPVVFRAERASLDFAQSSTPIVPGEMEVVVTLQGTFAIQ